MSEGHLRLPPLVEVLASSGRWPATPQESLRQNLEPVASAERIFAIAPDEERLYLYPPPFRSVASDVTAYEKKGWNFWVEYGALHELDPSRALIIGDFGPGSDSPILLDYRHEPDPCVIKLAWLGVGAGSSSKPTTTWVKIAESLDDFARRLGLA
jgi:hypothetical protein